MTYRPEQDIPLELQKLQTVLSKRQHAYQTELGNWQQQLDMIYHDFDGWKNAVSAIKNRYPKLESN